MLKIIIKILFVGYCILPISCNSINDYTKKVNGIPFSVAIKHQELGENEQVIVKATYNDLTFEKSYIYAWIKSLTDSEIEHQDFFQINDQYFAVCIANESFYGLLILDPTKNEIKSVEIFYEEGFLFDKENKRLIILNRFTADDKLHLYNNYYLTTILTFNPVMNEKTVRLYLESNIETPIITNDEYYVVKDSIINNDVQLMEWITKTID